MILSPLKLKSVDLDLELNNRIKIGDFSSFVLVVPTNRRIRVLKRYLIDLAPAQSSGKINLETLSTFSSAILYQNNTQNSKVLSEAAAAVLLRKSFQSVELEYFSTYKGEIPFGTLQRIGNVISEYKKQGITPALLKKETRLLSGAEKLKAEDIARVYEDYNLRCGSLGVKEIGDVYSAVNEFSLGEFQSRFTQLYLDTNLFVVNGFDEFTTPEIEIISKVSKIHNLRLFVTLDYYRSNQSIFTHLDKCYSKFIERGFNLIEEVSTVSQDGFPKYVREKLFNVTVSKPLKKYYDKINIINSGTREKEIENIAKEIKIILQDKSIKPAEICVSFNLIQAYSPIIRDVFGLYEIPYNLTDRYSLDTSYPVLSILNYLEILENDFYYKNIFRALGSHLIQNEIDISNLLYVAVNHKIVAGYDNWKSIITDELKAQNSLDDEIENRSIEKRALEKGLTDIKKIFNLLKPFSVKLTPEEFAESLLNLIHSSGLSLSLLETNSETSEKNVKALTAFIDVLEEITELLSLELGNDKKFSLKFYLNHLRTAISSSRYNIKEKHGFGVQLTTLNEIRGLKFKYLFIAGLCDGDLPTKYTPEIFSSGTFIKNEQNHQTEQRYLFYQALCSWENSLYLTYPSGEDNKELTMSSFLKEFEKLFAVHTKKSDDYKSLIFSKKDLLSSLDRNRIKDKDFFDAAATTGIDLKRTTFAIDIQNTRRDLNNVSEHSGILMQDLSDLAKEKLNEYKNKVYSISQLETYAHCPFKYFAERLLGIRSLEEPEDEIEPLEMGSLLHSILYEFYEALKRKRITLHNCDDNKFLAAEKMIFSIAEEKMKNFSFSSPLAFFEKERILGINGNRTNSILYKFIEYERESEPGFLPQYFELQFGKFDTIEIGKNLPELKVEEVSLRGKIDRVDYNINEKSFKVVDYKLSGKKPSRSDLEKGLSLQLPVYMLAAKKFLDEGNEAGTMMAGADIYSLKYKDGEFGRNPVIPSAKEKKISNEEIEIINNSLVDSSIEYINKYVNNIANGIYNLSTLVDREEKICRYCNFKTVCRVKEQE